MASNRQRTSRFFGGKSRSQKRAENNLGIIQDGMATNSVMQGRCRTLKLDILDKYYNSTQYDHLPQWQECDGRDEHTPVRNRKPRIIFPFARVLSKRMASKLFGKSVFPSLTVEDDPDTEEFLNLISKTVNMRPRLMDMAKLLIGYSSAFIRFKIVGGFPKLEVFNSKWCYPQFDEIGNLESVRVQYVFKDPEDLDGKGAPKEKWFRMDLGKETDILYNNPEFNESEKEPPFQVVERADHGFGFVQGEWFRTAEDIHSPDGEASIWEIMDFIDALNYNLSQSDQATAYGVDPQLTLTGMDEEDVESLIKSTTKAWLLGREGQANFLEINGAGLQRAMEQREDIVQRVQDIARIVFLDPEKIVGSAQSAKAMEVLHGPMVEYIDELRPMVQKGVVQLHQKLMLAILIMQQRGENIAFTIPPGFQPQTMEFDLSWPPIFPMTMQDLQQKVSIGAQLANANIMSRETVLRWLLKDFEGLVDNVDEEVQRINTQPQFGGFF